MDARSIEPSPSPCPRGWLAAAAAVIAVTTIAAHGVGLSGEFVLDDFGSVVGNPTIRALWPPQWMFPPIDAGTGGRPFSNLTLALDHQLGGLSPRQYRVTNVALHLANALTLFALVRRIALLPGIALGARSAVTFATVTATIWAAHPLTTAAVGYISQRTEVLMALCVLQTVHAFLRFAVTRRCAWGWLAVVAASLGMASKEGMVAVPVLVWLLDVKLISGGARAAWRAHRWLHCGMAATWLLLAALMAGSHLSERGVGFGSGVSAGANLLLQSRAVLHYLQLTLWPHPLVFDHGWDPDLPHSPAVAAAGMALVATGIVILLRRQPVAGIALAWFAVLLAPSSSVVPVIHQPVAESRAYLALAGITGLAVITGRRLFRCRPATGMTVGLALAGGLALLSAARCQVMIREDTLWRETIARQPRNARAHAQLGAALLRKNDPAGSAGASRAALRLRPDYTDARVNLALALLRSDRPSDARSELEQAVAGEPGHFAARYNLGLLLAETGRPAEAIPQFAAALHARPGHVDAAQNLAVVLLAAGHARESLQQSRLNVAAEPGRAENHYNLGNALAALNETEKAVASYRQALQLDPSFSRAHNNLGVLELRRGNWREARASFEEALRHRPGYAEALRNLEAITGR